MMLKCIAVDDEPLALDLIADYIDRIDYLELLGKCTNAMDVLNILKEETVDLLFLTFKCRN